MKLTRRFAALTVILATLSSQATASDLEITVLRGNDAVLSTRGGRGSEIRARVTDSHNQPIKDAQVTAVLPAIGAGGAFRNGHTTHTMMTNGDGIVEFEGIHVRRVPGDFNVRLIARSGRHSATAFVQQKTTELETSPRTGMLSKRNLVMFGVIGAGVAAGVTAALVSGNSKPATPTPATPSLTPGFPIFAGQR